ncbi:hypothetical protein ACIRP5_11165 [Streptomyces sp. NPDC101221]|uniref:hypothetical protein n=1 Tax=Streptomyces sp. NPDC101221 TaxID=3366132 RepID=UPI003809A62C
MAKKTITLFNGPAAAGVTSLDDIDLNAYEYAVLYLKLADKPTGNFTYNLYAHETVTNTFTSVAGSVLSADGTQRINLGRLTDEKYRLEFSSPGSGATVAALLVVEDA